MSGEAGTDSGTDWHPTTETVDSGKHGKDYEIEIAKFLFKRLVDSDFRDFKFTREKKGLGKFDDLTYIYEREDGRKKFCLVQVKHILDETKKISYEALAKQKRSYFWLPKYFNYYLESMKIISTDKDYADAELEELIFCTNIGMEEDLGEIKKTRKNNELFKNSGVLSKIRISDAEKRKIFVENYLSDKKKLANELSYYIMLNKRVDINNLKINNHVSMLKTYHVALAKDVIDVNTKKFKTEFLEGDLKENDELRKFRDCLFESISEFCRNCKELNAKELITNFNIKLTNFKEFEERLSLYESLTSIQDFLKRQSINIHCSFGDASTFPGDCVELPTTDINTDVVDNQINSFLEKLTFALEQQNNESIIRRETSENIFIAYNDKMNLWYYYGSYEDSERLSVRKREWLTKEKLLVNALETTVEFQGRKIKLRQLVSDKNLLDPNILMRTFCSLNINIGQEIAELKEINCYYITRVLMRQRAIDKNVLKMSKNDIFLLSHIKDEDKENFASFISECETLDDITNITDKSRFIITGYSFEAKDFDLLVNTYSKRLKWTNIHWIKYQGNFLLWESTYGSLSELEKHFYKNDETLELVNENDLFKDNRFVIISGEPGMGKSTLLNHIADRFAKSNGEKGNPDWVIKILLKDCDQILDEIESLQNLESATTFLAMFESVQNDFSQTLLKHFFVNENRTILLLDGFDELYSEDKQKKVIELLTLLKFKSQVKQICITTRSHFKENLEKCLGVISCAIKEISLDEQIYFLTRFWKQTSSRPDEQISDYTVKLIENFRRSISPQERSFLGIPLQTYMFAVCFQQEAMKENPRIPETFPITSLFEKFLYTKYRVYLDKFGENTLNNRNQQLLLKSYDNLYQDFALRYGGVFSSEEAELLAMENNSNEHDILLEIGIVYKFNNTFHFTHKTFAEYLIAKRLVDVSMNLKKYNRYCRKILARIFLKRQYKFLYHLFDLKLREKFPLQSSMLERKVTTVNNFSDDEINAASLLHDLSLNILGSLCDDS